MAIAIPTESKIFAGRNLSKLRAAVQGEVISPQDPKYDRARQAWNLTVNQRPALIIVAELVGDIVEAVEFAQGHGLKIAVQATGHGVIREADDSLLIITSQLTDVRVNPVTQTAWVSAGAKWGRVLAQTPAVS